MEPRDDLSLKHVAQAGGDGSGLREEILRLQRLVAELLLVNQRLREQLLGGKFGAKA
jgi:hypothetical protein